MVRTLSLPSRQGPHASDGRPRKTIVGLLGSKTGSEMSGGTGAGWWYVRIEARCRKPPLVCGKDTLEIFRVRRGSDVDVG